MTLSINLAFNGDCQEAFEFYANALNGTIGTMLHVKDSPLAEREPADWQDKIVHANILIEGTELAGGDLKPEQYQKARGFNLLLGYNTPEKVKSVFEALAVNGEVIFPPQKTFWSSCYAIVTDRFGVTWKINCAN